MNTFQVIFTPTSAADLARLPKELQLQILGDFRGLPQHVIGSELEDFGKLESDGHILHRFRIGDYRVYFERHPLGVLVHRILSRHTLKDFFFRSGIKMGEDAAGEPEILGTHRSRQKLGDRCGNEIDFHRGPVQPFPGLPRVFFHVKLIPLNYEL
jgi:mRNA-degrading endonuclease RelE of RelBE toxin-antitoxin system